MTDWAKRAWVWNRLFAQGGDYAQVRQGNRDERRLRSTPVRSERVQREPTLKK